MTGTETATDTTGITHVMEDNWPVCGFAEPVQYVAGGRQFTMCLRCQQITGVRAL